MECLHGKPASSTTTRNGLFWFCGQSPSCQFFCPEEDCYMFGKAVEAFRASGCIHPICHTHQKLATMRMVKDKMKESYGRPYFVCSEQEKPCTFWQWADVFDGIKPICRHGLICRTYKVKKEGPNQCRLFYGCPSERESACGFFEWKPISENLPSMTENLPRVLRLGCLFSMPPQYEYTVVATGEKFISRTEDSEEAYEEFLHQKSVDALSEDMTKLNIC